MTSYMFNSQPPEKEQEAIWRSWHLSVGSMPVSCCKNAELHGGRMYPEMEGSSLTSQAPLFRKISKQAPLQEGRDQSKTTYPRDGL